MYIYIYFSRDIRPYSGRSVLGDAAKKKNDHSSYTEHRARVEVCSNNHQCKACKRFEL